MTLIDVIQKPSVIEFEDKHVMLSFRSGEYEPDGEKIKCKIPELDFWEKIVLNAWGSWRYDNNYIDYRRRLGIYLVTSKEGDENLSYVLREEEEFSKDRIVHEVLSGNFAQMAQITEGLKYIALDPYGRHLS